MSESDSNAGTCYLVAGTDQAKAALGGSEVEITRLPFRVGRESRGFSMSRKGLMVERRRPGASPSNDLYLVESGEVMHISRNHFQIEEEDGGYALVDRGSTCGTIVGGETVGGGNRGGRIRLPGGASILVGTESSPYLFTFEIR